jgi:putative transposase
MRADCEDFGGELVEFNVETEHVHCWSTFPRPSHCPRLVNSLKGVSTRRLRQEFPDLARHYWRARRLWSESYFAGSVGGAPLNVLRAYIEQQPDPTTRSIPAPKARALSRKPGSSRMGAWPPQPGSHSAEVVRSSRTSASGSTPIPGPAGTSRWPSSSTNGTVRSWR